MSGMKSKEGEEEEEVGQQQVVEEEAEEKKDVNRIMRMRKRVDGGGSSTHAHPVRNGKLFFRQPWLKLKLPGK